MRIVPAIFLWLCTGIAQAQRTDTIIDGNRYVSLSPVVVGKQLDVPGFINMVRNDSSFYKAFRSLHLVNFTAINDIRMTNADGVSIASLHSKTQQLRDSGCRTMQTLEETVTGDIYNDERQFNYYTASMYANLFFTTGRICNENNIVSGIEFNTAGKSGMEKHKEQLKTLFFNPGRRIKGLPFMSGKTEIYEEDLARHYDFNIDWESHNGRDCYVFRQKVKPGHEDDVVIDEMNTWFDEKKMVVAARTYSLSYNTGLYDFKVRMEVDMAELGDMMLPALIRYNGNWKVPFKKRERGIFTATLYDFH